VQQQNLAEHSNISAQRLQQRAVQRKSGLKIGCCKLGAGFRRTVAGPLDQASHAAAG